MTQKSYLPFKWLCGDVNWVEHGGTWYAGPFEACLGEPGGYTYFFTLEWEPADDWRARGADGYVTLRVVIPSMWSADSIHCVLDEVDLDAHSLDLRLLLDPNSASPGHVIYSAEAGRSADKPSRVAMFRVAKEMALQATMFLGPYIDGNSGWARVAGDSPLWEGMIHRELERQARLGIILALAVPPDPEQEEYVRGQWVGSLIDEIDLAEQEVRASYKALQRVSQHWLEQWFTRKVKGFRKGR